MAISKENNIFRLCKAIKEDSSQNIIEGDIIVPDSKPDVVSVLYCDGVVKVMSKDYSNGTMNIKGYTMFTIVYTSDDPSRFVCSIENSIPFEENVLCDSDSMVKTFIDCKVEHVDCSILNGRKLNIKAILNYNLKVVEDKSFEALSNVTGDENIQVKSNKVSFNNQVELEEVKTSTKGEIEIPIGKPAIKYILRSDANILDKDVKFAGGKAVVKGNIAVRSLYAPDIEEEDIQFIEEEIPFSEVIDLNLNMNSEDLKMLVDFESIEHTASEDDDGDLRVIEYDIGLKFKPFYNETQEVELISDAYSISSSLVLEKSSINLKNIISEVKSDTNLKEQVELTNTPPIKNVYSVKCYPVVTNLHAQRDKVNVEGVVDVILMYISDDKQTPFATYSFIIPFNNVMDIKGVTELMKPEAMARVENCRAEVENESQVSIKITLSTYVKVMDEVYYDIITGVEEYPMDDAKRNQPSMRVYYVQSGDTLWDIAKRYYTTINELQHVNRIDSPELIYTGQQLLIPKVS